MTTARSDDDTWDIATSVGATAVMVAVARAAETRRPDPLIRDEYAELLALTPELEPVRRIVASWWAPDNAAYDGKFAAGLQHLVNYQAVRTHFFDEFLTASLIEQAHVAAMKQFRHQFARFESIETKRFDLGTPSRSQQAAFGDPCLLTVGDSVFGAQNQAHEIWHMVRKHPQ